jgi:hypothetical protein
MIFWQAPLASPSKLGSKERNRPYPLPYSLQDMSVTQLRRTVLAQLTLCLSHLLLNPGLGQPMFSRVSAGKNGSFLLLDLLCYVHHLGCLEAECPGKASC